MWLLPFYNMLQVKNVVVAVIKCMVVAVVHVGLLHIM